jgi:uncharacterized membrane protein YqjE
MNRVTAEPGAERKSFGKLLSQLSSDSVALLRDEMELAKQEMREKVKTLLSGLMALAIGAMIGQIAAIILCAAAVIKLAEFIGFGISALIIGVGLSLLALIVILSGLRKIRQTNLKPEKTIQNLKDGKEWLKEMI